MCIGLSSIEISRVFQPEFSGLFLDVLGNGKTWIIIFIGPILALIPDFLYNAVQILYFPNPSQKVIRHTKKRSSVMASDDENDSSMIK